MRLTLAVLPLVMGAFWLIRRLAVRAGGRDLSRGGTGSELAALAALVLAALSAPHLGLAHAERAVAAGFALVLAHRLVRQLLALRPLLGKELPARPSLLFFLLPLVAYLAILPWSAAQRDPDGDEPYYLLVAHSLAYDFDADLTNNYARGDWRHFMSRPIAPQPGDPVGPRGEQYSRHNELLPLLLTPAYRLGGKLAALASMAVFSAALAWMSLRLARHYVRNHPGGALLAYGLVSLAPPLLLYSHQVWVEVPAALLVVAALDRILALDPKRGWGRVEWLGIGLPILLLPLVKIRFLLIAAPLLAMGWWYAGRPRRPILILGFLLAVLAGGILLYNQILYSNPLKVHSWEEVNPQRYSLLAYLNGGLGLLFDAAFGLFGCAPVWLLLLAALPLAWGQARRLVIHLSVLALPYLVIVAPRTEWYGGWSPPFRYALIALPLLGLAMVPLLAQRRRPGLRAALVGLGALSLALALVWIAVPGFTYNFADGRTYLLDHLSERLGLDLSRFFASAIRPRFATWLWPPGALLAMILVWRWRSRRTLPWAGLAGAGLLLAGGAVLPIVADRTPTRVVEIEDPVVQKTGGHPHPERWVVDRTRFRGGWVLRPEERVTVPVRQAGAQATVILDAELIRNQPTFFTLDLMVGDRLVGVWNPGRDRVWEEVRVGPVAWPRGAPLVLVARGLQPAQGPVNGVILDRVRLRWQ